MRRTKGTKTPWWTDEQIETLNRLKGGTVGEIAEATGRSLRAVEYKMRKLGMKCTGLRHRGAYTPRPKAASPAKIVVTRGVYYCTCGAPVSDYVAHRERMGCVPPWLCNERAA